MHGIDRLLSLREENKDRQGRQAMIAPRFEGMRRIIAEGGPVVCTGLNLFQTPEPIARRMAGLLAERVKGGRLLEPSLGLGRLVNACDLRAEWLAVENAGECVRAAVRMLRQADKVQIRERDFMTTTAGELGGKFAGVLMNPPFKQGTDIKHIMHAADMLEPGGRLVGLCYNGERQNRLLRPVVDFWEVLPEGSFRTEGTGASVALVVIDKK